jgi:hypothetical protein
MTNISMKKTNSTANKTQLSLPKSKSIRKASMPLLMTAGMLAVLTNGFDTQNMMVKAQSAVPTPAGGKVKPVVSNEQREEYTSDFVAFDSDRNNVLDAQEVTANFQGQVKPREMHEFFRTADTNSDGKVSLMEYIDYAAELTAENKAEL